MGHSTTTARMHYDRCKPQRDAQRAMNGMHALRANILSHHGDEVARVVQGAAGLQQVTVKQEEASDDWEEDIVVDLDG